MHKCIPLLFCLAWDQNKTYTSYLFTFTIRLYVDQGPKWSSSTKAKAKNWEDAPIHCSLDMIIESCFLTTAHSKF